MNSKMLVYLLKRIGLAILTVWAVITITFFVMRAVPGGPFVGEKATTPAVQAAMEAKYGLDKPLLEQYGTYLKDIVTRFDFGPSLKQRGRQVVDIISDGMKTSAKLGLIAAFGAMILGIVFGAVAALRRNRIIDKVIMVITTAFVSMPSFIMGSLLLIFIFSLSSLEPSNLLPVTVDDALPVALGSLAAVDVLSFGVYAVCFIEGLCPREEGRARQGSLWLMAMVLLMSLLCLAVVGMFGPELCSRLSRPFFIMVRNLVFFHTVERVEALVVMLWLFPDFLLVSVFLYGAQYCLRLGLGQDPLYRGERLTDMTRGRWLIWPTALAAIACSLVIGPDSVSMDFWSSKLIPAINLLFAFVFIPSIYIVGKIKKTL